LKSVVVKVLLAQTCPHEIAAPIPKQGFNGGHKLPVLKRVMATVEVVAALAFAESIR
jgi:hypothetical protein